MKATHDLGETEDIFTKSIRLRNGKRIFASSYGLAAFRITVRKRPKRDAPRA